MPSIPDRTFAASCDSISKILSAVIAAIPVVLLIVAAATHNAIMGLLIAPLFTLILGLAYAWSPRGYAISGQSLVVKRLVGNVGIPLESVREVRAAAADDLSGCIKVFGNGGLFGYYGLFRTSKLGTCTWYVTSRRNSVVVVAERKTMLFSPDDVDGFVAAVRAAARLPLVQPGASTLDSIQPYGGGSAVRKWAAPAIAIVAVAIAAFALLYAPGPPSYTLTPQSLTIHDRFYPVVVRASSVDVANIRVIDLDADAEWRATARTNGFANSHYRSGWFRVSNGKTVRMYQANGRRLALLPPKGDGNAVLLETGDPYKFCAEVRQEWR